MTKSSRVAFVDESRRSNRYLLACALVEVRSAVIGQHQREHEVRSQLLGALVPQLQTLMVGRLVIESRDGRDDDDKIAIHRARRPSPPLPYEHQTPADEPFALAAGCVRLGRRTRARVGEAATEDPQTLKSAEPGTPVEGGSPGPLPAGLAHRHLQYAEQQPKVNVRGSTSSATATWPRTRRHSSGAEYRLVYDVTSGATRTVGGDMVVECWISHGPRADDAAFDPQPGDWLTVGDHEEPPRQARVVRREANRVWVQLNLPKAAQAVA